MKKVVQITLSYTGNDSNKHLIDFYDVSKALIGFQRSIALTTHLVLNNEIITQATALKGATIYTLPSESGSWKITAVVAMVATGGYNLGTAPVNTPLGHIVHSVYDYVVSENLGVHIDYEKSLGQLYDDAKTKEIGVKKITQSQADWLAEKCSGAVLDMHRPISKTQTAKKGTIITTVNNQQMRLHGNLTLDTFAFLNETKTSNELETIEGFISSYTKNTYKGRIFVKELGRAVTFELAEKVRTRKAIDLITRGLRANALNLNSEDRIIFCTAYRNTSRSGQLKSFLIMDVYRKSLS